MDLFIAFVKGEDGTAAMSELAERANSFGFSREVPAIIDQLKSECLDCATIFCAAIIKLLSEKRAKHGIEGRMEACMRTAEQIAADVIPGEQLPKVEEMQVKVDKNWLHPTVFQQLAQVAFLFFDSEELREKHQFDRNWWKMPLI